MDVEQEVHQRADQARPAAAIDDEARPADLGAALDVEQSLRRRDLPVGTHAVGRTRRAPAAHDDVRVLATLGYVGERDVGNLVQDGVDGTLRGGQLLVEPRDLLTHLASLRDELLRRLLRALPLRDLLGDRIARRLSLVHRLLQQAALLIDAEKPVDLGRERVERATPPHRLAQVVGALAEQPNVVHQKVGIESGTTER